MQKGEGRNEAAHKGDAGHLRRGLSRGGNHDLHPTTLSANVVDRAEQDRFRRSSARSRALARCGGARARGPGARRCGMVATRKGKGPRRTRAMGSTNTTVRGGPVCTKKNKPKRKLISKPST